MVANTADREPAGGSHRVCALPLKAQWQLAEFMRLPDTGWAHLATFTKCLST